MTTFVLVHGGWGGGWEWRWIAPLLRERGSEVFTPTLTGLGERVHLATPDVGLDTHIEDVANLLDFEDLSSAVLVGWSYGSVIVDGVADLVPDRVSHVINLDGFVAVEGRCLADAWSEQDWDETRQQLAEAGETWRYPPPTEEDMRKRIPDRDVAKWFAARLVPHPIRGDTDAFPSRGSARSRLPHTYVRFTQDEELEDEDIRRLRDDPGWTFLELDMNHLGIVNDPATVAAAIFASSERSARSASGA